MQKCLKLSLFFRYFFVKPIKERDKMQNSECEICGGCAFRSLGLETYRRNKEENFNKTINSIKEASPVIETPVFMKDGSRRRAELSFEYTKKELKLGFNANKAHDVVDITHCDMLDEKLNSILFSLHTFLTDFCQITETVKNKKKLETISIRKGKIYLLHADNGIDILLDLPEQPRLQHRLLVAEFANKQEDVCRFSWSIKGSMPETVIEKYAPELHIKDFVIEIPQGAFLQASKDSETAMIEKMQKYMGDITGKIADLFCGLGTFTYPLAKTKSNEIISADSSQSALEGLKKALNRNQIQNVKVVNRNLFKYPFDKDDLKGVKAVVIDPPRAGAHEQCRMLAGLPENIKPSKIIFISCNPQTFVYDAEMLIKGGYKFDRVTLIDQFVYSKHQELIALFTFNPKVQKGE